MKKSEVENKFWCIVSELGYKPKPTDDPFQQTIYQKGDLKHLEKELTIDEFLDYASKGHLFVPVKAKSSMPRRIEEHIAGKNVVFLDFDGFMTLEEMLDIVKNNNIPVSCWHTSSSHLKDGKTNKFRAIVVLDKLVIDKNTYNYNAKLIADQFGGVEQFKMVQNDGERRKVITKQGIDGASLKLNQVMFGYCNIKPENFKCGIISKTVKWKVKDIPKEVLKDIEKDEKKKISKQSFIKKLDINIQDKLFGDYPLHDQFSKGNTEIFGGPGSGTYQNFIDVAYNFTVKGEVELFEKILKNYYPSRSVSAFKSITERKDCFYTKDYMEYIERNTFNIEEAIDNYFNVPHSQRRKIAKAIVCNYAKNYEKINDCYYVKNAEGFYKPESIDTICLNIKHHSDVSMPNELENNIVDYLKTTNKTREFPKTADSWITFNDCYFNFWTGERKELNDENVFSYIKVNLNYSAIKNNKKTRIKDWYGASDMLGKEQFEILLAYCYLSFLNEHTRYCLFWRSKGGEGKNLFFKTIGNQLSEGGYWYGDTTKLLKEFSSYKAKQSILSVFDETSKMPVDIIKGLTGSDIAYIEQKYQAGSHIRHNVSMVYLFNETIEFRTFKTAEKRRFILLDIPNQKKVDKYYNEILNSPEEMFQLILTIGKSKYHDLNGHLEYRNINLEKVFEVTNNEMSVVLKDYLEPSNDNTLYLRLDDIDILFNTLKYKPWEALGLTKKGIVLNEVFGLKREIKKINGKATSIYYLKHKTLTEDKNNTVNAQDELDVILSKL